MQIMNMTAIVTRPRARDDGGGEGEGRQGSTAAGSALALAERNLRPRRFAYATSEEAPKLKSSPSRGSCVPFVTQSVAPARAEGYRKQQG